EEERQKRGAAVADEEPAEQTDANQQRRTQQALDRHEDEKQQLNEMLRDTHHAWTEQREGVLAYLRLMREYHEEAERLCSAFLDRITARQTEMPADLLTKSLPTVAFQRLRASLGVVPGR
ncbi:MAG: hypothetical protein GY820_32690, partial [Gammaproteobacteria bacterium]|nr:hypothetical protein [Gammaproteobacteria bacterium]